MTSRSLPRPQTERDVQPKPLTLFYLVNETNLSTSARGYDTKRLDSPSQGKSTKHVEALVINFNAETPRDQPLLLLTFGSGPECNIILHSGNIQPVHCRLWAQSNSGRNVFVLSDNSTAGTMYVDSATYARQTPKLVTGRPKAVTDLQMLQIGPYVFSLRYPRNDIYSKELDDYFSINERLPVTKTTPMFESGATPIKFCLSAQTPPNFVCYNCQLTYLNPHNLMIPSRRRNKQL